MHHPDTPQLYVRLLSVSGRRRLIATMMSLTNSFLAKKKKKLPPCLSYFVCVCVFWGGGLREVGGMALLIKCNDWKLDSFCWLGTLGDADT